MAELSVTQLPLQERRQRQTARHAALARAASHRPHGRRQRHRPGTWHVARGAPPRRGQGGQVSPARKDGGAHRAALLAPARGSRRPRKRIGRGEGSGTGKTSGRGQKGAGSRAGSKSRAAFEGGQMPIHMRMRKLRGPHMKKSMPFEMFRTHTQPVNIDALESRFEAGTEVTIELMKANGLATRKDIPVKVLAKGELSKALTRPRPRLQRRRARAHRGGRRHLHHRRGLAAPAVQTASRASASTRIGRSRAYSGSWLERAALNAHALDDSQRLPGRGHPQEDRHHGGPSADLPRRLARARAGRQPDGGQQHPEAVRRLEHPRPAQPLLRRRPLAHRDLRAGDHALHHRLDHPAAAAGGRALAREARQGRRGRPGADHAVHPLPDGRAGIRAVDRLRLPVPHAAGQSGRIGCHALRRAAHLPDRRLPDDGLRAA